MPFSIALDEDDLRSMEPQLREGLLRFYFDSRNGPPPASEGRSSESPMKPTENRGVPDENSYLEVDGGAGSGVRVTFPEFFAQGLLRDGDEIWCRALKRDRRNGADEFVRGAKVAEEGRVEFNGRIFSIPSKLALAMANSVQGARPAPALNGYDYLFVRSGSDRGLISLKQKRADLTMRQKKISGSGVDGLQLRRAQDLARSRSTAQKPVTRQDILRAAHGLEDALSAPGKPFTLSEALDLLEQLPAQERGPASEADSTPGGVK